MEQEDYLLRQIVQMGMALARIRRMLLGGKNAEVHAELERAARTVGLDLSLLIKLDERSVRPFLLTGGAFDQAKCAFFAQVVYLEWRRQVMECEEEAEQSARRALMLYALAYNGIVMDAESSENVAELEAALS